MSSACIAGRRCARDTPRLAAAWALTNAPAQVLNPDLVKGPWRKEEDDKVRELVAMHGAKKWSFISSHLPGRIGKQCRER